MSSSSCWGSRRARLTGRIVPALQDLIDRQLVRVIDLIFIEKDPDGTVRSTDLSAVGSELRDAFAPLVLQATGSIGDDDVADLSDTLAPGDSVAVLLFEHLWALPFTEAVSDAGGELVWSKQVSAAEVDATLDES